MSGKDWVHVGAAIGADRLIHEWKIRGYTEERKAMERECQNLAGVVLFGGVALLFLGLVAGGIVGSFFGTVSGVVAGFVTIFLLGKALGYGKAFSRYSDLDDALKAIRKAEKKGLIL